MNRNGRRPNLLLGAGVVGLLGTGAAQVAAAPRPDAAAHAVCVVDRCRRLCEGAGFTGGFCDDGQNCICFEEADLPR